MTETRDTSAARLVSLLEAIADVDPSAGGGLTVAEGARALGRDKSVVSRQLRTLVELGVVERNGAGRHSVGWRLLAIAARAGDQRLLVLAPPVMRRLTELVRERAHFSVRRGTEVLTLLSESPQRAVEAVGWVGRTSPLTCSSAGRALLFDLTDDEIREMFARGFPIGAGPNAARDVEDLIRRVSAARQAGVAAVEDEFEDGLIGFAAPVRDPQGRIAGVLSVSAPSFRIREKAMVARSVLGAANHLTQLVTSPPGDGSGAQ